MTKLKTITQRQDRPSFNIDRHYFFFSFTCESAYVSSVYGWGLHDRIEASFAFSPKFSLFSLMASSSICFCPHSKKTPFYGRGYSRWRMHHCDIVTADAIHVAFFGRLRRSISGPRPELSMQGDGLYRKRISDIFALVSAPHYTSSLAPFAPSKPAKILS